MPEDPRAKLAQNQPLMAPPLAPGLWPIFLPPGAQANMMKSSQSGGVKRIPVVECRLYVHFSIPRNL